MSELSGPVAAGDSVVVPVDGDWRVPMVMGDESEGWLGICHPVAAWRVVHQGNVVEPIYAYHHDFIEEDGDVIGHPHRATPQCCEEVLDPTSLGLPTLTDREPMCVPMKRTWFTARVRAETARRRAAGTLLSGGKG